MKKTITALLLLSSISALAQTAVPTVELNALNINVESEAATLVRTNLSPEEVTLTMRVPMANTICERYETRMISVTSSMQCGTQPMTTTRIQQVCVRRNPGNNQCLRYENQVHYITSYVARTCLVPDTFCAQYGTQTSFETDEVVIKFKDLPELTQDQKETYSIKAQQRRTNGENVVYEVKALETLVPVEVKDKGLFGLDKFVIRRK